MPEKVHLLPLTIETRSRLFRLLDTLANSGEGGSALSPAMLETMKADALALRVALPYPFPRSNSPAKPPEPSSKGKGAPTGEKPAKLTLKRRAGD